MIPLAIAFAAVAIIAILYGYRTLKLDVADSVFMGLAVALVLGALIGGIIFIGDFI